MKKYDLNLKCKISPRERQQDSYYQPFKKKAFGQHFLRKQSVVDHMIEKVVITPDVSVLEIGCGDGFLTQAILEQTNCKQLWSYEIDPEWATVVKNKIKDPRLTIKQENFLEADFAHLEPFRPWVVLANLPYQVTFPILFIFQKHKHLFNEGVVMVQEEVAQKIVGTYGRGYNQTALFLQHHFEWKLMEKIEPGAFVPPPKIFSRLLYFKPKTELVQIPNEEKFWKFLKLCFKTPRQTLRNNLKATAGYPWQKLPPETLNLRAQQISFEEFIQIWQVIYESL
jgi:16S rRNA (adenine1518-N6/adenine1519-N6)-dimethyltransferase